MKKTVLYIGGFELPDKNAAAQRVMNNAKAFKELSYNVFFLGVTNVKMSDDFLVNCTVFDGFTSYKENHPTTVFQWLNYLVSIRNIKILVSKIGIENIESVIAYNYPSIALKRLLNFCHKNNIKLISDCTEWAVEPKNNSIRSVLKNLDTFYRMHYVHFKLDGMIVISKYLFDFYSSKMNKVLLVPPLVDHSENKWKSTVTSTKDEKLKLVYAGSPGAGNKDRLDLVINALSKIKKDFTLTIVGLTKEQYLLNVIQENLPKTVVDKVFFLGRVSHLEAIGEVKNADFSIFLREDNLVTRAGFPTKFVESISCGTPVLTNASSNVLDYLEESNFGGVIIIDSEEKLITSLNKYMSLSFDEIKKKKQYCHNSQIFDYTNYVNNFKIFNKE